MLNYFYFNKWVKISTVPRNAESTTSSPDEPEKVEAIALPTPFELADNMQRKITLRTLTAPNEEKTPRGHLIVVATLVNSAANLGGA